MAEIGKVISMTLVQARKTDIATKATALAGASAMEEREVEFTSRGATFVVTVGNAMEEFVLRIGVKVKEALAGTDRLPALWFEEELPRTDQNLFLRLGLLAVSPSPCLSSSVPPLPLPSPCSFLPSFSRSSCFFLSSVPCLFSVSLLLVMTNPAADLVADDAYLAPLKVSRSGLNKWMAGAVELTHKQREKKLDDKQAFFEGTDETFPSDAALLRTLWSKEGGSKPVLREWVREEMPVGEKEGLSLEAGLEALAKLKNTTLYNISHEASRAPVDSFHEVLETMWSKQRAPKIAKLSEDPWSKQTLEMTAGFCTYTVPDSDPLENLTGRPALLKQLEDLKAKQEHGEGAIDETNAFYMFGFLLNADEEKEVQELTQKLLKDYKGAAKKKNAAEHKPVHKRRRPRNRRRRRINMIF